MIQRRIALIMLIVAILISMLPLQANAFKASDITSDTLYDNGILLKNIENKYKHVTNLDVVKALYRLDLICDYHLHKNKEIKVHTNDPALFWMHSCLGLSDDFMQSFNEEDVCTKETLSVLFYQFAKHLDFHLHNHDKDFLNKYSDVALIPKYSQTALSWALQNKIIPETYEVNLNPLQKMNKSKMTCSTGYNEPINFVQLETYFVNYFLYLELEKTYGEEIVDFAKRFLGYDYIWGGCTQKGFDCSGFIYYVFSNSGHYLYGHRDGAHNYSTHYGSDIMEQCLDINGDIDWEKVPLGAVIGFDWEGDGEADHVGIWSGDSLIHARGGPNKQYAYFGYMVCEYFEGEGNGLDTTFDGAFNAYYQNCIVAIRSFERHRTED